MNAHEPTGTDLDDDGTAITELLERAERSFHNRGDDKFYATREEIFLLASQQDLDRPPRIEKDCGGNWIIEIYYSRMIFTHATSCLEFIGGRGETVN